MENIDTCCKQPSLRLLNVKYQSHDSDIQKTEKFFINVMSEFFSYEVFGLYEPYYTSASAIFIFRTNNWWIHSDNLCD